MAPKKPAPYEERKGTVGTGQKPGPLFNPPPVTPAAAPPASRSTGGTGGAMFGGGGNAGKGQTFGGIAIPPAPVSGGKTRPGTGGRPQTEFGPGRRPYTGTPEGPPDLGIPGAGGGGIGPREWDPNGPRTRNTPFGRAVTEAEGGGGGGGDEFTGLGYTPYTPPGSPFSAIQIMENMLFAALGIRGLGQWAADLYNRGASPTEIVAALRYGTDTSDAGKAAYRAYLDAFPRMNEFLEKRIFVGENPEMQYMEYRNTVREAGARYNINEALVSNAKIADYIGGMNSAAEIVNRMNMAAVAISSTPADTISTLRDYYGVNNSDLMSFYLDTDTTEAMLQQRYAAAQIGTEALRQQVQSDRAFSEELAMRGVTTREAQEGFQKVARQRAFEAGRGETATQRQLAQAAFGDEELTRKIERIGGSRVGAFQGGGGYAQGDRTGLAGSSV